MKTLIVLLLALIVFASCDKIDYKVEPSPCSKPTKSDLELNQSNGIKL